MSEQRTITMRFADPAEKERYGSLREQPDLWLVMCMGHTMAEDWLLPRVADGRATYKEGELDRQTAAFLAAGLEDLDSHFKRPATEDERFMFRKGYEAAALPAKEEFERLSAAGQKLGEAFVLATASLNAASSALDMLSVPRLARIEAPKVPPHVLALQRRPPRPLRPEDFGALPPSRGVHGSVNRT